MYSSNTVISLLKSMVDFNYSILLSYRTTNARSDVPVFNTRTVTSFKVTHTASLNNEFGLCWYVFGY